MFTPPNAKYRVHELWSKESPEGAEIETSELLASLVRHQKPIQCLETGTAHGQTAEAIGKALQANGRGELFTCDIDLARVHNARGRVEGLPVKILCQPGIEFIQTSDMIWDFVFIDSWWVDVRIEEMRAVVPKIAPGGLLCLHDPSQNYKWVYDKTVETVSWPNIVFHAPYGLAVFRKPSDEDWSGVGKEIQLEPIV
jgi:predicted O-methyltransferase YrrM